MDLALFIQFFLRFHTIQQHLALLGKLIRIRFSTNDDLTLTNFAILGSHIDTQKFESPRKNDYGLQWNTVTQQKHPTSWVTHWLITIGSHIPKSLKSGFVVSKKQRFSATLRVQNLRMRLDTSRTERMCSESRFLSLLWLQVRLGRRSSNSICVLFKSKGCKGGPLRVPVIIFE